MSVGPRVTLTEAKGWSSQLTETLPKDKALQYLISRGPLIIVTDLTPNIWKFKRPFLDFAPSQLKGGVKSVVIHKDHYFREPIDYVHWQVTTPDGKKSGEGPLSDIDNYVDLCAPPVLFFSMKLLRQNFTPGLRLPLPSEYYVSFTLDFARNEFSCEISTIGKDNADSLLRLLTFNLNLIDIALPEEHSYLKASIRTLTMDHPETARNVLLIMRFREEAPFPSIVRIARTTCEHHKLKLLRTDDCAYTDDLWDNVMTYMYACSSAIAVFDEINARDFNPNVALEVGFMLCLRKPVLLLKDTAIKAMPSDIIGKIYRPFDSYRLEETIPPQVEKWVRDCRLNS